MINRFLFKQIDNSSLIVFRIIFGLLCFLESVGAIFTGWVKRAFIEPDFTFTFIGFDWLQPLPGNGMYVYYVVMGLFGLCIMLGYKYRFSALMFTLMWTCTYLMQKSSYNNHYYLLILLSAIMVFMPANRHTSIDAKLNPSLKKISMPYWCKWVFIVQMFIVYTYGSIAKIYPDWLDLTVMELLMKGKQHYYLVGDILQQRWIHYFLSYGGILFDGLIIPLLLFKPTRKWAFFASIFFHLFNSFIFQVGIFPYLSLAFALFFFDASTVHKIFLKRRKPFYSGTEIEIPKHHTFYMALFGIYFLFQIGLPLRHHAIEDDVLWTEEGHRMSWRMMLRSKQGIATYRIIDQSNNQSQMVNLRDYLTRKQMRLASTKPDVIWQFAQHLKKKYAENGQQIEVYVDCKISVNGKPYKQLTNPEIDLASTLWDPYKHAHWLLPSK